MPDRHTRTQKKMLRFFHTEVFKSITFWRKIQAEVSSEGEVPPAWTTCCRLILSRLPRRSKCPACLPSCQSSHTWSKLCWGCTCLHFYQQILNSQLVWLFWKVHFKLAAVVLFSDRAMTYTDLSLFFPIGFEWRNTILTSAIRHPRGKHKEMVIFYLFRNTKQQRWKGYWCTALIFISDQKMKLCSFIYRFKGTLQCLRECFFHGKK